jgi:hypothetical protein
MDAGDRMVEQTFQTRSMHFMMLSYLYRRLLRRRLNYGNCTEEEINRMHIRCQRLTFIAISTLEYVNWMREPHLSRVDRIISIDIDYNSFSTQKLDELTGFSREDIILLHTALNIPDNFVIGADRHRFSVAGQHCFLYLLFRMHSPSIRQTLDSKFWGYDYSVLSKIFNKVLEFIDMNHSFRLRRLHMAFNKLEEFNFSITQKIQQNFPNENLPPDSIHCALFADACRFRIARPHVFFFFVFFFLNLLKLLFVSGCIYKTKSIL